MKKEGRTGRYVRKSVGDEVHFDAYVPKPLPPRPPLDVSEFSSLLDAANIALGRVSAIGMFIPEHRSLLFEMYMRREAVSSCRIEGVRAGLYDLLLYEAGGGASGFAVSGDVDEVWRCVSAMEYGFERLGAFPLSLRFIREMHRELMSDVRVRPGEFRRSQNWIGGISPATARFVPPPVEEMMECLYSLERFMHDGSAGMPSLIKVALVHAQFETIHPFLDGNGRTGRLLVIFMLVSYGLLTDPVLGLSMYLEDRRLEYYDNLELVRDTGDWEEWVRFFLVAVIEAAHNSVRTAVSLRGMFEEDRASLGKSRGSTGTVQRVYDHLQRHPVCNTSSIRDGCGISLPTVLRSLHTLESLGIVEEITGRDRYKIFVYRECLETLERRYDTIF